MTAARAAGCLAIALAAGCTAPNPDYAVADPIDEMPVTPPQLDPLTPPPPTVALVVGEGCRCGPGMACESSGTCVLDLESRWQIRVRTAPYYDRECITTFDADTGAIADHGCADSPVPGDLVVEAKAGDLFGQQQLLDVARPGARCLRMQAPRKLSDFTRGIFRLICDDGDSEYGLSPSPPAGGGL